MIEASYSQLATREILESDAEACGRIAYEAHKAVASVHNYPPEQPSVEFSVGLIRMKLKDPNAWGFLAERRGRIAGSVFLNTFPPAAVAAIGPLTVDPSAEGGVGHELMVKALGEAKRRGIDQVRLVQSPSHLRSLALYSKLGFDVREPLVLMQGKAVGSRMNLIGKGHVRAATKDDLGECNDLCVSVHGFSREYELLQAIQQGVATVVECDGRIAGYSAGIGLRGHSVAKTTEDLKELIGFALFFPEPGFFVHIRNGQLLRWLLSSGLRILWPANLMTLGSYKEPGGAFLPSIAF